MKLLKYLYFFLLFLGLLLISIQTKAFNLYNQSFQSIDSFEPYSNIEEIEWLGLLYLKENPTLAIHSKGAGLSIQNPEIDKNPELAEAWKVVSHRNVQIRTDVASLEALSSIMSNPSRTVLGITDEVLGSIKGSQNLAYKDVIKTLNDFGKKINGKNITLTDFHKVVTDLTKGDGWTEGAEWTLKYIGDNIDDFAGKHLAFEVYEKWDGIATKNWTI